MAQSKYWCFTINDPQELLTPDSWDPKPKYLVYQMEYGSEEGLPHFQGYVEFYDRIRMLSLKELLGRTAHCEVRRGSAEEARDYCMKAEGRMEGPYEWGTWAPIRKGQRTDWEALKTDIKANATNEVLAEKHFALYVRYNRGINAAQLALSTLHRTEKTRVLLLLGAPGLGKSTWCSTNFPDAYWKPPSTKWFDSYGGQRTVVLDDFSGGWFSCDLLKRLMDNAPLRVETKGGTVEFLATTLIITSNYEVAAWYPRLFGIHPHQYDAITRRVDILYVFNGGPGEYVDTDPQQHFIMHRTPLTGVTRRDPNNNSTRPDDADMDY